MSKSYLSIGFAKKITDLHLFHYENSKEFKNIVDSMKLYSAIKSNPEDIFLHTSLFKKYKLKSKISNKENILFYSSGTSGIQSKIYTDRLTRIDQQRSLYNLICSELGFNTKNKPSFYVIDKPSVIEKQKIDAKYAAIKGFSSAAKGMNFLLDEQNNINYDILNKLRDEKNSLVFGFTANTYIYFLRILFERKIILNNKNITLIHGGGWKKLINQGVSNEKLKEVAINVFPNVNCKNYYGMIEQTGSIYFECDYGFLHSNDYASVLTRNNNLEKTPFGKEGIIQSISSLPKSYPGHSLLTEDKGIIYGCNTCKCGKGGVYFHLKGRLSKAVVRGCSDVY